MSTINLTGGTAFTLVGGVVHFHLEGTSDCHADQITIQILCDGGPMPSTTVPLYSGNWSADVTGCKCGQPIQVTAKCGTAANSDPYQTLQTVTVPCPPPVDCCPVVKTDVVLGECDGPMRSVTLTSTITIKAQPCPLIRLHWDFGGGNVSAPTTYAAGPTDQTVTYTITHAYPCNTTQTAKLIVVASDLVCSPAPLQFHVPCCNCCPAVTLEPRVGPCTPDGKRTVTLAYAITPAADPGCSAINATLALGGKIVAITNANLSGTVTATLAPGHYSAGLTLASPKPCPAVTRDVEVPPCDCCPQTTVTSEVTEKCNKNLTKRVDVVAAIVPQPGCPVTAVMSIDGVVVASGSGGGPFVLTHQGDYDCGDHVVTIAYPGTACSGGGTFCVSVCEAAKCKVKRQRFEIAATVAHLAGLLFLFNASQGYLLLTAAVATVLAVIFFFQWKPCLKRCRKCQLRLANWQIAFAVFVGFLGLGKSSYYTVYGILSVYVSPVIAVLIIVLIVLLIAFLIYLAYRLWVARCCPTDCEKWTAVLDGLVIAAIASGIVLSVIALNGATGLFVAGYVGIAIGLFTAYVLGEKTIACSA